MKKVMFFIVSLLLVTGAMAQIDVNKEYRIKYSTGSTYLYLNIADGDPQHQYGNVSLVALNAESDKQIFKFIDASNGKYKLQSISGSYIVCAEWNVNHNIIESEATDFVFEEAGSGQYKIKWYNTYKNANKYFKVEAVGADNGTYHPFGDSDAGAVFTLEPVSAGSYTISILGNDVTAASVLFDGKEYKNGATIDAGRTVKKYDFTATEIAGKHHVINIDMGNGIVSVSYFDNSTKFYIVKNGKDGYLSLNSAYMNGNNMLLTNTNAPGDTKGLWAFIKDGSAYKIYNYSTGLSKVLGITGNDDNARATMVAPTNTSYTTKFDGTINLNGSASYIKKSGTTSEYWNRRDDKNGGGHLAVWNSSEAVGDKGSTFYLTEANYEDYPESYVYEITDIKGNASFSPKNPNTLWYKTSAEATGVGNPWMEYALPLGNGELGCMVYGGVHTEELQFNEKTLWSGAANVVGATNSSRTFVNFGSLFIVNDDNAIYDGVTDYVRYLDIEEGVAGVEFKNAKGKKQVRKYFSSAPDQVIAGQYKCEEGEKLNLTFKLEPCEDIGAGAVTYSNGTASFTGAMEVSKYAARLHVVANDDAVVTSSNDGISVKNATEVTFYLKGATNFNGDMEVLNNYFTTETPEQVNERVKGEIERAVAKGYDAVETDHIADFTAITKRMTFDLGLTTPTVDTKSLIDNYYPNNTNANSTDNDHLFLEQLYFHYGRYLAISSNRKPIAAPNNLQGIWNNLGRAASDNVWNSDIHTNINIQMNYWPTEITNLSDLHKPFVNFIIRGAQSEGWKKVAQQYNNGYGWSVLTESSLYNSMSTWGSNYLVANVWYTSHLWTHWRYTQDKEFLRKAFPVMWSCAEFWFHRLVTDRKVYDGTYVAPNEYSAEQPLQSEDGTAHAQQMISYLFQNISDAIEILGANTLGLTQADIAKLEEYLAKTDKGLHTETYDGGWGNPFNGVKSGEQLLREWKYSTYKSGEKNHRHMSHMMALFPLDQITPESDFFTPAVNALKHRGDEATGWSMGWKVNLWARAQDGDHAHVIIKNALKHSTTYGVDQNKGGIYYNLFDSHAPFQIDGNFGVCSGMAEMLMQSAHGYINILPALPMVWEKSGEVKGMKAMGNFVVDFNWAEGKCLSAKIVSNAGAELRVRCARGAKSLDEARVTVDGKVVPVTVDEHGIATISCEKDAVVEIDFTTDSSAVADIVVESTKNGAIYDIQGRRVNEVANNKIYIQDGIKKISK